MLSVDDARSVAIEKAPFLGPEKVEVLSALGRASAEDVCAAFDHPRWDKSAMDGFGFRAADIGQATSSNPVRLRITETLTAGGGAGGSLGPGEAVRIMTGAVLPPGADAVVPLEEAKAENGYLRIQSPARAGQYVRKAGDEIRQGARILDRGEEIRPTHIESLTTMGRTHVAVGRRPSVAVFSTGDEVVEPEDHRSVEGPLGHGRFYCSINYYMAALVLEAGGLPLRMGIAEDRMDAIVEHICRCAHADAVLITGGTGKGDKDLVEPALRKAGVEIVYKDVAMWPGTYSAFGLLGRNLVFNVPGNPSAAHICFEFFVRPSLRQMAGFRRLSPQLRRVRLGAELRVKPREGLPNYVRGRVMQDPADGSLAAMPWKSENLPPSRMNAFLVVPAGVGQLEKGDPVAATLFSPPWEADEGD
ncbi:MAG: gephyrin-like molybdotransferase Glp [Nitrospinota bacterium]